MGAKPSNARKRIRIRRRTFAPLGSSLPFGLANHRINVAGKKKGRTMNPLTQSKNATILPALIALTLGCFGLSPQARAVCREGCLTNNSTVLGDNALFSHTNGGNNTAIGWQALFSTTTTFFNTAIGANALYQNTGANNTAIGDSALGSNTTGGYNTASGVNALLFNTTGFNNTASGSDAMTANTTGIYNTAIRVFLRS